MIKIIPIFFSILSYTQDLTVRLHCGGILVLLPKCLVHIIAEVVEGVEEGVGPLLGGLAVEGAVVVEVVEVPEGVVGIAEVVAVVGEVVALEGREMRGAEPGGVHHLGSEGFEMEVGKKVVVLQDAPEAKPVILALYELCHTTYPFA